jgi:hypothetical protein
MKPKIKEMRGEEISKVTTKKLTCQIERRIGISFLDEMIYSL